MSFTLDKVTYPGSDELNKFPDLNLTRKLFLIDKFGKETHQNDLNYMYESAIKYNMAPFYTYYCGCLSLPKNFEILNKMEENNKKVFEKLDENIENARSKEGDLELRDAIIEKAEYMAVIGVDLKTILEVLNEAFSNKTCSLGIKFKILFLMMRACIFHEDRSEMGRVIRLAKSLGDEQIDWETRNKFKLYCGLYSLWNRDFSTATTLFHQIFTTFGLTEVVSYHDLGIYTILVSTICLPRSSLKKDVIDAPEIHEATYNDSHIRKLPNHLYNCAYQQYFAELHFVDEYAYRDIFLHEHARFLREELRITAYKQLLCSFKSLKVEFLAHAIGQTIKDVDNELSYFISMGKLACRIDEVNGLVYNAEIQNKDVQFYKVIKEGDVLLSKINKLLKHVP